MTITQLSHKVTVSACFSNSSSITINTEKTCSDSEHHDIITTQTSTRMSEEASNVNNAHSQSVTDSSCPLEQPLQQLLDKSRQEKLPLLQINLDESTLKFHILAPLQCSFVQQNSIVQTFSLI